MSSIWVPWQPNPNRFKRRGLKRLWHLPLLLKSIFFTAPALIFWGGVGALVVVVWLHSELFHFFQTNFLDNAAINDPAVTSVFGGALSLQELQAGVQASLGDGWGFVAYLLWPLGHEIIRDLVAMGGVIGFISIIPLFAIWWERKVSAHIQNRLGPMRVGGWHGWTQTLADGVKLIGKEDLVPKFGDGPLFRLAPYLTFVPPIMGFMVLPFGSYWIFRNTDIGLLFILAMLGVEVVGVIIAGWASNNKWSVYGAMREACQMVSYEIPLGMALMLPVMAAGTLSLAEIGDTQTGGWFTWYCFMNPAMFCTAIVYYIASLASCKRAPFDMAEAESELVAGFLTEYSGFRWSMFFFGEYCSMFLVSGLQTILFFGAWHSPLPQEWVIAFADNLKLQEGLVRNAVLGLAAGGPLWFIGKCALLLYVQMWVRWTLPRVRIDHLLYACIQVLLPIMMFLLLGHALWMLYVPTDSAVHLVANKVLGVIGAIICVHLLSSAVYGYMRRRQLVGNLAVDALPGS